MSKNETYIKSQIACAMIELEAMKIANHMRISNNLSPAYGEEQMLNLMGRYGLHHNTVIDLLNKEY